MWNEIEWVWGFPPAIFMLMRPDFSMLVSWTDINGVSLRGDETQTLLLNILFLDLK